MRVVLDTNVLVSAIFFAGVPGRILEAWSEGRFEMLASVDILAEYRRVVARLERRFPSLEARPVLDLIVRECRLVVSSTTTSASSASERSHSIRPIRCRPSTRTRFT